MYPHKFRSCPPATTTLTTKASQGTMSISNTEGYQAMYLTEGACNIYEFDNKDEMDNWVTATCVLKELIRSIDNGGAVSPPLIPKYCCWLAAVDHYCTCFGVDKVPLVLRNASLSLVVLLPDSLPNWPLTSLSLTSLIHYTLTVFYHHRSDLSFTF